MNVNGYANAYISCFYQFLLLFVIVVILIIIVVIVVVVVVLLLIFFNFSVNHWVFFTSN